MRILITGGGTGGHLAIAKSIKEDLNKRGFEPIFVGSEVGQDRLWFENEGGFSQKFFLPTQGVVNKKGFKKFSALWQILQTSEKVREILAQNDIDAVFSVGGYAAAPASIAAIRTKTPLYIHEQNAITGRLNKLLSPFAKRVFSSFAPPYDPYPVAERFFATRRLRKKLRTILFLGGSQGAKQINDIAIALAPHLQKRNIAIIHQTGKKDFHRVKEAYESIGIEAEVFDFRTDLPTFFAQADLAIARAGASSLWELSANALPTIFVPYPYAANNHQYFNAKFLVEKEAALLFTSIQETLELLDTIDLTSMSQKLLHIAQPGGAKRIVDTIVADLT